jgi:hypothetical protein
VREIGKSSGMWNEAENVKGLLKKSIGKERRFKI